MSAPQIYKIYCHAQVLALLRSAPLVFLAVLPTIVEFALDTLQLSDDNAAVSMIDLLEACAECDGETKFCAIAITTGLRVAATRWPYQRDRCVAVQQRWIPEQAEVFALK